MSLEFEKINCPLCGCEKNELFLKTQDRFNLNGELEFKIVACSECTFIFLNPRPKSESISAFYESENYQPFLSIQSGLNFWDRIYLTVRSFTLTNKRRKISKLKRGGRLLDIGCGTGEFLHEMQDHGWQVEGLEMDEKAAEFARTENNLSVQTLELQDCDFPDQSFDVITLWHVLEHLYDPKENLKKMRNFLKDGGFILIAVPNISSLDARFYKSNWVALDAPRHLFHFTPETMSVFCKRAGLGIQKFYQLPLDAFFNCLMSERIILKNRILGTLLFPLHFLRGFLIAKISIFQSLRLSRQKNRLGSSILYFVQKQEKSHDFI